MTQKTTQLKNQITMRILSYFLLSFICLYVSKWLFSTDRSYAKNSLGVNGQIDPNIESEFDFEVDGFDFPEFVAPSVDGLHYAELFETNPLVGNNSRWVVCNEPKARGKWRYDTRTFDGIKNDYGLLFNGKASYRCISTEIPEFTAEKGKDFIFQYELKQQEKVTCGGSYIKLMNYDENLKDINSETPYIIMFGPDVCGPEYNKVLFIIKYKQKDGSWTEHHAPVVPTVPKDLQSHVYSLWLKPDNSYEIYIDHIKTTKGDLLTGLMPTIEPMEMIDDVSDIKPNDWDDKLTIYDPLALKPDDWDENEPFMIQDPESVKPENWVDEPYYITDTESQKPEDWDELSNGPWNGTQIKNPKCQENPCGTWEPKMIVNPNYKGKWFPPKIPNPNYKGVWTPKKVKNPDHFQDFEIYRFGTINTLAIETWNVEDNIIIDNIIIADNIQSVLKFTQKTWKARITNEHNIQRSEFFGEKNRNYKTNSILTDFKDFVTNSFWILATSIVTIAIVTQVIKAFLVKLFGKIKKYQREKHKLQSDTVQQIDSVGEFKESETSKIRPQTRKRT